MKLWQKNTEATDAVTAFTVGKDREMDTYLAKFDVIGSLAHVKMLGKTGLLTASETQQLVTALRGIYKQIEQGQFPLRPEMEDIHSQVEWELTQQLGDTGKKVHMARSRNDQVLVDIRLFLREELEKTVNALQSLFALLQEKSEQHKEVLLPGYTHLQLAMPSSFGLWFGAYAESLVDDCIQLQAAYKIVNKNPLGSAAIWFILLHRQILHDFPTGIRGSQLQCGLCTNGTWKNRTRSGTIISWDCRNIESL